MSMDTRLSKRTAGARHFWPQTTMGRRAWWLLLPVLFFPLYGSVFFLIPDSWPAVSIAVVIVIIGLAVASLVTAGVAIFRDGERSVLVLGVAVLTFLLVVTFAVGEVLGYH